MKCTLHNLVADWNIESLQAWLTACNSELGGLGSLASIASFAMDSVSVIFSVLFFVVGGLLIGIRNKKNYATDLAYFRDMPRPNDFINIDELPPEKRTDEKVRQRKAKAFFIKLEAYTSKQRIKRYESSLNSALAFLQRFFKEPEWGIEDVPTPRSLAHSEDPSVAESSLKTPSFTEKYQTFWQLQKSLFNRLSSEGSYQFCLYLAFAYPLIFAMANGFIIGEVNLAGLPLFKFDTTQSKWLFGSGLLLVVSSGWVFGKSNKRYVEVLAGLLLLTGIVLTVAFAGAVAFAFAFAFAVAVAGAFAFAVAGAGAGAVAVAVAMMIWLDRMLVKKGRSAFKRYGRFSSIALCYLLLCSLTLLIFGEESRTELVLLPLLLGILPILNAPIDWLSLNFTRALSYQISRHHGQRRYLFVFGLVDVLGAIVFMVLITSVMLSVLTLANYAAQLLASKPLLPFTDIMQGMLSPDTYQQYYWVHFMVLSTLIPTLVHFILLLVSLAYWPLGHAYRAAYANFYDDPDTNAPIVLKHQQNKRYRTFIYASIAVAILGIVYVNAKWGGCALWTYADGFLSLINTEQLYQSPTLQNPSVQCEFN